MLIYCLTRKLTVTEDGDTNNVLGWHCDQLLSQELNLLVRRKLDSHSTSDGELSDTFDNLVHAAHVRLEMFRSDIGERVLLVMILNEDIEIVCEHRMQYFGLTMREQEVVKLVQFGFTNPQISSSLHISPKTVENHLTRIYAKTYTHNKTSLLRQLHVQVPFAMEVKTIGGLPLFTFPVDVSNVIKCFGNAAMPNFCKTIVGLGVNNLYVRLVKFIFLDDMN